MLGRAGLTSEGVEPHGAWGVVFLLLFQLIHSVPRSRARPGGGAQRPLPPPLRCEEGGTLVSFEVSGLRVKSRWVLLWPGRYGAEQTVNGWGLGVGTAGKPPAWPAGSFSAPSLLLRK